MEGDILLNITGDGVTFGRSCVIPPSVLPACVNQHVSIIRLDPRKASPGYVLSFLTHPDIKPYIESFNSGGSRRAITKGHIESFRLALPPLPEQRAIAHILGTLDDKIELNRRMNETLEAMARALFKSWFVDFDPVHAKAQGRKPAGMDAATAALFPSEFQDSDLGPIPKGWRATTLGAEAERCGGAVQTGPFGSQLHASDYVPLGVPVVMPKDIAGRRVSTASVKRIREADAERLSRHRLQVGDLVYSRRGDVERHALISSREVGWLCGTGCLLVRLGPTWPSPAFASLALDRPESRAWISQHAIGATMPNLNTSILSAVPLVVPSDAVLQAFARNIDPLERLHVATDAESASLADTRDALLPRLLSGELQVSNLEEMAT
jgi:type I restriction enzyme S subunit